jgi:hypothetical protein
MTPLAFAPTLHLARANALAFAKIADRSRFA